MKLTPLRQWVCDSCGKVIDKPENGWCEWYTERDISFDIGFRIVHHTESCMYDDRTMKQRKLITKDFNLTDGLGAGGLGHFLHMIELSEKGFHNKVDIVQLVEMMRRLYIPYYEEARLYWNDALRDSFHDGCGFDENILLDIIENYGGGKTDSLGSHSSANQCYPRILSYSLLQSLNLSSNFTIPFWLMRWNLSKTVSK